MITYGVYRLVDGTSYDIVVEHTKKKMEVLLGQNGAVVSAYKKTADFEGAFNNKDANNIAKVLNTAVTGCTARNGYPTVFALGACSQHTFKRSGINFEVSKFNSELCGAYITSDTFNVELKYNEQSYQMPNIEYVKYSHRADLKVANEDNEEIPVRSLEEIALTKDITWLKNKKYYIVNDEEQAEQIFNFLDNFNGTISYDTETTGLRINMFCQIGSEKKKQIEEYNKKQKEAGQPVARVDRLVGMIYCVQEGVSYYFPCFNRKFKNLYDNVENPTTKKVTDRILSDYTIGKYRDRKDCMAEFIRNTPVKDWGSDVILMERNRNILSTKNLLAHNGKFEWKVCWNYNIDFHLVDDTIIEHQLLYKYKVATTNRGERSDLKFLTKKELGCDQLELTDFFAGFSEDDTGIVNTKSKRANKSKVKIDFSYMDYDGARAYAPADGDFTLGIYHKYKKDLVENHPELDYLYRVEVLVSQAMAYMEYYGHRIDPLKIDNIRKDYEADKIKIEHKLRQLINYSEQDEENIFNEIESIENKIKELKAGTEDHKEEVRNLYKEKEALQVKAQQIMDESVNSLNLGSPAQVADLFYNKLGIKCPEEKQSINKKILKGFLKEKNEDGSVKYPVVKLYKDWKDKDTALSKFFGNLPDYMYPGGFIFSDFGQIAAATGRMTCKHPNAQQYPKAITAIVKPRDGFVMIDADFSQIEYRTLVALAHEESLLEKFKDPDMDYHTTMAALMYGVDYASVTPKQRSEAKSFNFGIPYGMGFGSLAILLTGINTEATRAEAEYKYELYFKDQPNVRQYFRDIKEMAVVRGYTQTKWGRRRYFSFTDKDGNYSNALKARALRQAGNAVIQGTAADIFKIGVARNFSFIRKNNLFGKMLIVNMIHDEQLIEADARELNIKAVVSALVQNMEMKIDGFPPLYVGAGVGLSWKDAKGKMNEINPRLAEQFINEASTEGLYVDAPRKPEDVLNYFNDRVFKFRENKILEYVRDESNRHKALHPVIGNLLSLQFDYGVNEEVEAEYTEENGYSSEEIAKAKANIPIEQLKRFLADRGITDIDAEWFKAEESNTSSETDDEEDVEYEDEDEEDEDEDGAEESGGTQFRLIDESNTKLYGIDIRDVISEFGVVVSKEQRICGIDATKVRVTNKDKMAEYIQSHVSNDPEADTNPSCYEVVFLLTNNAIKHTGGYVCNINQKDLAKACGFNSTYF